MVTVLYTCSRKISTRPISMIGMSGLPSSVYAYLLKTSGPKKIIRLPTIWMTRYRNSAKPVTPIRIFVPTEDEKTPRRVDMKDAPNPVQFNVLDSIHDRDERRSGRSESAVS